MSTNVNLRKAKINKQDEFYTQLTDIENELKHYEKHFKNKIVLCNCDDPRVSNFFKYFSLNFEKLKLKRLITTCYKSQNLDSFSKNDSDRAIGLEYHGDKNNNKVPDPDEIGIFQLKSDGDFRSRECIEILKKCDIVCTNPPFSLFKEYVTQLMKRKKKFIIIGNKNAIAYNKTFKLIKENKMWLGTKMGNMVFRVPDHVQKGDRGGGQNEKEQKWKNVGACWFTNLDITKRHEKLILYKKYNEAEYPKLDNYNAINVNKTKHIPIDYKGKMAVPITFMDKFNPDQFEIIGKMSQEKITDCNFGYPHINKKRIFARIIIKRKEDKK